MAWFALTFQLEVAYQLPHIILTIMWWVLIGRDVLSVAKDECKNPRTPIALTNEM